VLERRGLRHDPDLTAQEVFAILRRVHFRIRALAAGAILSSTLAAAPAWAQSDEVFLDPESPSAKEYAIPIESARRGADPGRRPSDLVQRGATSSPLFGAGVRATAATTSSSREPGSRDRDTRHGGSSSGARESPRVPSAVKQAASNPPTPGRDAGSIVLFGGAALLVVAGGVLVGVVLRRQSR